MGLPIWRSPSPSPRPAAAALCDVGPTRTAIRRRISPRTSPRDNAHRFVPVSRSSRSTAYSSTVRSRSNIIGTLDSRSSHAAALSLSQLDARLNWLHENALQLRTQHRQLIEAHVAANESESASNNSSRTPVPAITNDYGLPYEPEPYSGFPVNVQYERSINQYQRRLTRARQEIQRLEGEGLQLDEQRRRLNRLHADFYNRHLPYGDLEHAPLSAASLFDVSRSRDDSELVPHILSVPARFTASPQPIQETLSSGAVRASSSSSSLNSSGPEMELPPLRRMGDRSVGDRSPERTIIEAYTVEEVIDEFAGGLGDRDRSVEPDHLRDPTEDVDDEDEETWNTMLATIAPDARLPSASSSFASDAASRSFSSSNNSSRAPSAFSTGTTITVPEENGCDTEEVWRTIGERFNRGEDVPDELWVNAGVPVSTARILSRSVRERL